MASINISELYGRGRAAFIVTTTTFILATLFVVARVISRFGILAHRTADDWLMILAWQADWRKFIAFGLSFAIDYGTSKGLGRPDADLAPEWLGPLRSSEYAFTILYNPALMVTKTSILVFYLRMSKNTQSLLRIASYITLGIVNVAGVVLTFLNTFQCSPVRAAYDPALSQGRCLSIVTLYLCSAPVNIITDLAILVLPIPVLTGMRLPQRQKTILVLTFALGIFVTVVDVVRIYYLQQASNNQVATHEKLGTASDFPYNASPAFMWSAVEVNVGIICACIPTLKPLVTRILPSMLRDLSETGTDKDYYSSQLDNAPTHRLSSTIAKPGPAILPLPRSQPGADPEDEVNMMSIPGMEPGLGCSGTQNTHPTENSVYFGFVNMKKPKSMLKTRGMESFKYCTIVTILFFLWGFSYGLLNSLNNEISKIAHQRISQDLGLTTAYFGAYFFGAMTVGQWTLRHVGFKATFITGLCVYGVGTLIFWPSAVLSSFPGFIISNFVVGFGLSILETAANPFIVLCGPSQSAEYRLLLSQGVQAVGSVLSQLLAERVLFATIKDKPSLIDVQWTYLAVALFSVILALFFYYMPLPEASDFDLLVQSENLGVYESTTVFSSKFRLVYVSLGLAVFAQFVYVAAQESMSVWFNVTLSSLSSTPTSGSLSLSPNNFAILGLATFAIGRFLFAPLCLFIPPRILLMVIFLGCLIFSILAMSLNTSANGITGVSMVFFFFEGPVFPMIYAIGLRGLGTRTKMGAGLLTAAGGGGGIFQFVMFAVQRLDHKSLRYSYCVIVALFSFGLLYPVYLNVVPKARRQVDPVKEGVGDERPETPIRRLSRRFSDIISKIGGGKNESSPDLPVVEHRESR
ncbi:L-fucose-proton symporter [Lachnellula hyalina]|uniref:L-fucose-proton symporter n=1 Tax=Lachnellula hyalina TaxID=1316788 RepID=A0A8H8QTP8_9HELO|nr:L-fucose-proton symporter [Lachnellula hyalina]TVY22574.1 L-fucose-proton symporter [Lachnellula hyalina]